MEIEKGSGRETSIVPLNSAISSPDSFGHCPYLMKCGYVSENNPTIVWMARDICIALGKRIRQLRKERGWRQIDLAEESGIHEN